MQVDYSPARRYPRFATQLLVVSPDGGRRFPDRVVNLSLGGARIETTIPMLPGARTTFYLLVPHSSRASGILEIDAEVVWVSGGMMGVRFTRHPADLTELVSAQLTA